MKRKLITFVLAAFTVYYSEATGQNDATIASNTKAYFSGNSFVYGDVLGADDDHIYTLVHNYASGWVPGYFYSIQLVTFNKKNGELISQSDLVSKEYVNKGSFDSKAQIYHLDDKLYLIFSHRGKNKKETDLTGIYFQEISFDGKLIGNPVQMPIEPGTFYEIDNWNGSSYISTYTYEGEEKKLGKIFKIGSAPELIEQDKEDLLDKYEKYSKTVSEDFLIYPEDNTIFHDFYFYQLSGSTEKILVEFTYKKFVGESPYFNPHSFSTIAISKPGDWKIILPRGGILIKFFSVGYPLLIEKDGSLYLFYNDHTKNFETTEVGSDVNLPMNGYFDNDLVCVVIDPKDGSFEKQRIITYDITKTRYFLDTYVKVDDNTYNIMGFINGSNKYTFYQLIFNK